MTYVLDFASWVEDYWHWCGLLEEALGHPGLIAFGRKGKGSDPGQAAASV